MHATLNIGIALGFGAQGKTTARPTRTLEEIDADIARNPQVSTNYLEKADRAKNPKEAIKVLRAAYHALPAHFDIWINLLTKLADIGSFKGLSTQTSEMLVKLDQFEERGSLSGMQVSVVLGQLAAAVLEKPASQGNARTIALCVDILERAVARNDASDFLLFYLGLANYFAGNMSEAERRVLQCLELRPQHARARQALTIIRNG